MTRSGRERSNRHARLVARAVLAHLRGYRIFSEATLSEFLFKTRVLNPGRVEELSEDGVNMAFAAELVNVGLKQREHGTS